MKVEYVCVVTLDATDVRRATSPFGIPIEHPFPPSRTIIRICADEQTPQTVTRGSDCPDEVPWGVSARDHD